MFDGRFECRNSWHKNEESARAASGSITHTLLRIKKAEENHCGAVITKAIVLEPGDNTKRPSRRRLFLQEGIDLIRAAKKETKIPIIANVFGAGRNLDGWASIAKECEKAGADALELNLSCPNVGILQQKLDDVKEGQSGALGALLGQSPKLAGEATAAVLSAVKIPVFCKMTPEAPDMPAVAGPVSMRVPQASPLTMPSAGSAASIYITAEGQR